MTAVIFPGQGSQFLDMAKDFNDNFDIARSIFTEIEDSCSFNVRDIIFNDSNNLLNQTNYTQISIFAASLAIYKTFESEFLDDKIKINYMLGHSLGEYSALVCSESLKFEDALFLLFERGKSMQEAVPVGKGSMIAVLGSQIEELNNFIKELKTKGVCEIANDNSDGQIIVSGNSDLIGDLQNTLKINKKKSILLPVSAPFHCSLMKEASEKMRVKINTVNFNNPKLEIISNVTASPETDKEKIKKLLVEQIYTKVRWRESILFMISNGIDEFIEIGPGKVLSGLVRRINKDCKSTSVNSIENIKEIK